MLFSRWLGGQLVIYPGSVGPGTEYFVDSTHGNSGNSGKDWEHALATIDQAVNKCEASHGNIIWVAPYHTEALAADSAIDIDVAGVSVIGVKYGRQMPTLSITGADGDCKLAAANCTIQNFRFTGDIDATTGCIEVSAADCAVLGCEFRDVTGQATDVLITTAAAERLLVDGFQTFGAAGAGANSHIAIVGAVDGVEIRNFNLYGNFAVGAIDFRGVSSTCAWIHDGLIWTENAADIAIVDTITGSTGTIGPNLAIRLQDDAANITTAVTGATFHMIDPVYIVNAANEKAMLSNWTASTHA